MRLELKRWSGVWGWLILVNDFIIQDRGALFSDLPEYTDIIDPCQTEIFEVGKFRYLSIGSGEGTGHARTSELSFRTN